MPMMMEGAVDKQRQHKSRRMFRREREVVSAMAASSMVLLILSIYGLVSFPPFLIPALASENGPGASSRIPRTTGLGGGYVGYPNGGNKRGEWEIERRVDDHEVKHFLHEEAMEAMAPQPSAMVRMITEQWRRRMQLQPGLLPSISPPQPGLLPSISPPQPNLTQAEGSLLSAGESASHTGQGIAEAAVSTSSAQQSDWEKKAQARMEALEQHFTDSLREQYSFCIENFDQDKERTLTYAGSSEAYRRCSAAEGGQGVLLTLCSVAEAMIYFKSLLPSTSLGITLEVGVPHVPNNRNCNRTQGGKYLLGCAPGFASNALPFMDKEDNDTLMEIEPDRVGNIIQTRKCCDGFFCPEGLACMLPCPLGSYCVEGTLSNDSYPYCSPYTYQPLPNSGLGCGGADFWGLAARSQAMFCPEGYFCNTTTEKLTCPSRHYCRRGSTEPLSCLIPSQCEANQENQDLYPYGLFGVVVLLVTLVALYHCSERAMQYRVALHDRERERLDLKVATHKKVQKRWKTAVQSVISLRKDPLNYARAESISSEASSASLYSNSPKKVFEHIVQEVVEQEDLVNHGLVKGIELEFIHLSLTLKNSGKRILDDVTGKLSPKRVTAVMGPSGAGKTTFLTALAGKKSNQTTLSGKVLVNGKEDNIRGYKRIIGFVPQDDIVHANLTVEENLWFSARYRLPSKMTEKQKASTVERTLRSLGLSAIRHAQVGSVERRGISGGQRKRVNVGVEMVMEPSLLILDEPTSGLDSTSSRLVIQALRREAKRNVNVGVVLHQPSYTIFKMFHDVMFLAKGGRVVYHGPVEAVEEYFEKLGFSIPERINPPDHIMDVLDGHIRSTMEDVKNEDLPQYWHAHAGRTAALGPMLAGHPTEMRRSFPQMSRLASSVSESSDTTPTSGRGSMPTLMEQPSFDEGGPKLEETPSSYFELELTAGLKDPIVKASAGSGPSDGGALVHQKGFWRRQWRQFVDEMSETYAIVWDKSGRSTPGFFAQLLLIMRRCGKQRLREPLLQLQDYVILLITGLIMGLLNPVNENTLGADIYPNTILAMSLLVMIAALRTFSADLLTYWRESASGINRISYFLAKDLIDWIHVGLKPLVYLLVFHFFTNPRSKFQYNYAVTVCMAYCVTGVAYVFSILFKPQAAQLTSAVFVLISVLVGTRPPRAYPKIANFVYTSWAFEAFVIINAQRYTGAWILTRCATLLRREYDINNFIKDLYVLLGIGAGARIVALLCLAMCNRKKQR